MLNHDLTRHLDDADHFTLADQSLRVGVMKGPDGHLLAIMVIDGIVKDSEARWLGARIKEDVLTWVRSGVPDAADGVVTAEVKRDGPEGPWRLGVYTFHNTLEDAALVTTFLGQYAAATAIAPASGQVH